MAILHGSWLQSDRGNSFVLWGETWRRLEAHQPFQPENAAAYPFAMEASETVEFVRSLQQGGRLNGADLDRLFPSPAKGKRTRRKSSDRLVTRTLALPTRIEADGELVPHYSASEPDDSLVLYPWTIEGLRLDPAAALEFLHALPLGHLSAEQTFIGADLRFWSHIARWSLDLLGRRKFLPAIDRHANGSAIAHWVPLLDSATDRDRLMRFAKQMPAACRAYQTDEDGERQGVCVDLPPTPTQVLREFLNRAVDVQVRQSLRPYGTRYANDGPEVPAVATPAREWLDALSHPSDRIDADPKAIERLEEALDTWIAPVQPFLAGVNQFRTCCVLQPPPKGQREWTLDYYLQAVDDREFLVDAKTIWSHPVERFTYLGRAIENPQETLLSGLGLASRLYEPIEASLHAPEPQGCRLDPIQAYEFIKAVAWRFEDSGLGVILPPSLTEREGWANRLGLSIRAADPKKDGQLGLQSLLNFKWELTIGGQRLSKAEFDRITSQGSPLVEVNGEWIELRPQDVRAAESFFESRKDQMNLSLEDALRLSTGDTQTVEKLPVVNFETSGQLRELLDNLTGNRTLEAIAPPAGFRGELRPYQARGVGWLTFLERWGLGACLADDMGLGKTIQTIAFLLHLQERGELDRPVLLVCPTSVLGNWEREVHRFGPSLKVIVHHGDKRSKGKTFAKTVKDKQLVVTSYPLVQRDAKDLQKVDWQGVILDEAQNIKNPEAKQSRAVRQLEPSFRIALTGTPVENRLQELWSILDFLNPGYLGPRNFFQRRFATPIEKYGDTDSLKTLRSLVQPFILRRLKTDRDIIQDLPDKQEMTVFCPLSTQQASLYQKVVDDTLEDIEAAEGIQRRGAILGLLVKLKQICNHPLLWKSKSKKAKEEGISPQHSGKLQRLHAMLEELISEGDRAIIFTQFAEWGKLLKPYLEQQLDREVLFLYGNTRKKQREEMVDRFQQDPQGPPILILSLKAGGTGLNLTRANHVFHFDRWWNPAVENQATDRVFRIGQTRNVQVHKFVCTGTLEEKIHHLIESKKELAEQVVGEGEQWLTELDTDSLRNLLLLDRSAVVEEDED